jgi:outer membrane protein assembly factor BamB
LRPVAFGRDTLFVVEPYTPAAQLVPTTPRAANIAAGMAGVAPTAPAVPGPPPPAVPMPAEIAEMYAAERQRAALLQARNAQIASQFQRLAQRALPGPMNPPTFVGPGPPNALAPPPAVRIPLSGFATTDPLVHDGAAWLGLDNHRVAAFDVWTGRALWSARIGRRAQHITRAGDRLFVAAEDHATALDAQSGTILWGTSPGRLVTSAIAVAGDRVCFGTADDTLHIHSARSGDTIAALPLGRVAFGKPAVDDDGVACFATGYAVRRGPRGIHAIDVARGTIRWRYDIAENAEPKGREEIRGPAVADDLVVFAAGNTLHALDRKTGVSRWKWSAGGVAPISTPVPHRGAIFVASHNAVFAVDAQSEKQVWVHLTAPGQWSHRMADDYAPVIHRDVLYHVPDAASVTSIQLPRGPSPRRASVTTTLALAVTTKIYAAAAGILIVALALVFGLGLRRLVIAAACAALAAVLTWAWIDSYNVTHFAGKRIFTFSTGAGSPNAEHSRGVTSRRGTLNFGASHIVWDSALTRPMPTNPTGGLCVTLVPLDDDPIVPESTADDADLGLSHFALTSRARPSGTPLGPQAESSVTVPHWFLIAALSIAPLAWATGLWRDRKRYPKGHCPNCGYDLRASPQRCPECGWQQKTKLATDERQMEEK